MGEIGQYIANYGFPMVACAGLFWYIISENRKNREIIENNTALLRQILSRLEERKEIIE